jgi:hypothetical protein
MGLNRRRPCDWYMGSLGMMRKVQISCLMIVISCSGPRQGTEMRPLRQSNEFLIADAIQVHTYAHYKRDIGWFMSTYRRSGSTEHMESGMRILGWKAIEDFYRDQVLGDAGVHSLDYGDLDIELLDKNRAYVRAERWKTDAFGQRIERGQFSATMQKRSGGWDIISSSFEGVEE